MVTTTTTEKALFALGCFWHAEDYFVRLDGVTRVRVGHIGHSKKETDDPTYRAIGPNGIVLEIEFDPSVISYRDLLRHFWNRHEPTELHDKGKYVSVIYPVGKEQYAEAVRSREELRSRIDREILTEIVPADAFDPPREYHEIDVREPKPLHAKKSC